MDAKEDKQRNSTSPSPIWQGQYRMCTGLAVSDLPTFQVGFGQHRKDKGIFGWGGGGPGGRLGLGDGWDQPWQQSLDSSP